MQQHQVEGELNEIGALELQSAHPLVIVVVRVANGFKILSTYRQSTRDNIHDLNPFPDFGTRVKTSVSLLLK